MRRAPAMAAGVLVVAAASCRAMVESPDWPAGAAACEPAMHESGDSGDSGAAGDSGDAIRRLERVARSPALGGAPGVEITVTSAREFPVLGTLAVLRVGSRSFTLSRYATGDLHTLVFTLTLDEFDALDDGAPVAVQYGSGSAPPPPERSWSFGALRKRCLR
jgi:hypothetical protein